MNDPRVPDDDIDALASAYLDGELSAEDAALVEADPALVARAEELAAASSAIGDVPIPAGALDDLVDRVMATGFPLPGPAAAPPAAATPATRATRRGPGRDGPDASPRLAGRRRIGRVTAVAGLALVLVVAVPLALLVRSAAHSSDSSGATSAAADSAALATSTTGATRNADGSADEAQASAAAPTPALGPLGSFSNGDDLLAAARGTNFRAITPTAAGAASGLDNASPFMATTQSAAPNPCPALTGGAGQPTSRAVATATLAAQPVYVLFVTRLDGTPAIVVANQACEVVLDAAQ